MKPYIGIGSHKVGHDQPTYIIAEIGSNFDGSLKRAKHMVDLAKEVGADAAKFQTFKSETIINQQAFAQGSSFQAKWKKSVWDTYKDAEFPIEWHAEISAYCKSRDIDFLTSPYSVRAVELCEELDVVGYKIGSGEITNLDFLKVVASKGRPIILGCGAATIGEIDEAVRLFRSVGNDQFILLQCVTMYPTPFEQANIRAMVGLQEIFDCSVGYSDHTPGIIVPLGAVALGARVIEKHFTDDKLREGPDHPFAMDVRDFREMVNGIRTLESALGSPVKDVAPCEVDTVVLQRRSLFVSRTIKKGTPITEEMIAVLRPQKGLLPKFKSILVGRVAKCDMEAGEEITWDKV